MLKLLYYFLLLYFLTLYLFQTEVYAKSLTDEVVLPSSLQSTIDTKSFVSIGETTFSVLFWDIYKSELLTTSGNYPVATADEQLLFDINYLADISSADLISRTVEQWQHLGIEHEVYEGYLTSLSNIWPDIEDGDNLSLLIHQGRSVFYFNGQYAGVIHDPKFGKIFTDIWLSENTSQPNLRRELLARVLLEGKTDE